MQFESRDSPFEPAEDFVVYDEFKYSYHSCFKLVTKEKCKSLENIKKNKDLLDVANRSLKYITNQGLDMEWANK